MMTRKDFENQAYFLHRVRDWLDYHPEATAEDVFDQCVRAVITACHESSPRFDGVKFNRKVMEG